MFVTSILLLLLSIEITGLLFIRTSGAEAIVGLVAAGAGLASLVIQLGESATKLRKLYYAAKNAPRTIARLAFDLDTMALTFRELEK